jgi:hypothetical protein
MTRKQLLLVEDVTTDNAPDGQMWPPALGDRWVVARELDGARTLWRRISLNASNTSNTRRLPPGARIYIRR